jgi:hypothetical protein
MRKLIVAASLLGLAACATNEPGWTGSGAAPFGSAQAECEGQLDGTAAGSERDAAFQACMAARGWTRLEGKP